MDCVLSYHMNPLTCGVAKFNLKLARELGVSMHQVLDPIVTTYRAPLLSMKMCEFDRADVGRLGELLDNDQRGRAAAAGGTQPTAHW